MQRATGGGSFRDYQAVILAEFVAAELLVAVTPIGTRKHVTGISPYLPRDMTKLLAIGVVYFILELAAVGGHAAGRLAAWFGGLVLLTVGLNEAANIAQALDIFGGSTGGSGGQGGLRAGGQGGGTGGGSGQK